MIDHVTGIVLGAGDSTRMGGRKQQLEFGNTTLLGWAVRQAEASSLDEVVIVTSPDDVPPPHGRARTAVNDQPSRGSVSSLMAGVEAAGAVAVMVLLGDMPGVSTATIENMLEPWRADPRWAAVAHYHDGLGHPLILSPFLAASLATKKGDKVLWPLLESAPDSEVLFVDINQPRPMDVNTHDDYVLACQQLGFEPK
ncbi:MAG: NTP transferase domain-containing protein [Acidimicrobiia bacterium]|nr:NTP transferase domain-containing protein [Acidimicrobiia bacterium]